MVDYETGWDEWTDMVRYSPAPFHRRRLITELARGLGFESALDVGCGPAEVLKALRDLRPTARLVGVDLSEPVIARNRRLLEGMRFETLDLAERALDESFDLVVCSEVVEHIADWPAALANLRKMCAGHLIITVPTGRIFPIDEAMGHTQHFGPDEMRRALAEAGFEVEQLWRWGFPFHSVYKYLINIRPQAALDSFAGGSYGTAQKAVAGVLRNLFYLNTRRLGRQLIVRARAVEGAGSA